MLTDYVISQEQVEITLERTESQKCFSVRIVDDGMHEDDETFLLRIASVSPIDSRIQLNQTTATITIIDDDLSKFSCSLELVCVT